MLTPGQKLKIMNNMMSFRAKKINRITHNSPTFQALHHMMKKGKLDTGFPDFEERIKKKQLDFKTKKQIYGLEQNWIKQKYKVQRCVKCGLEIPGDQQTMIWHLRTHFGKYTEHRSRIEQLEAHPYQYV